MLSVCGHCGATYMTYKAASRYCGKPCSNSARGIPPEIRFWSDVQISQPDECWPWTKALDRYGYGAFTVSSQKQLPAHRFAYQHVHDIELSDKQKILHICIGMPHCCNPLHLYIGSDADNTADKMEQNRQYHVLQVEDVLAIRQRYDQGEPYDVIALDYPQVTATAVYAVGKRINWKHVPEERATI